MTRIWVLSDLHVDVASWSPPLPRPEHDVLIIAGDVGSRLADRVIPWLSRELGTVVPLVYVPGNHCFYRTTHSYEKQRAREAARRAGVHLLLDGEAVEIAGVRIVGATLWTDYAVGGQVIRAQQAAGHVMTDHRAIRTGSAYRRWTPQDAAEEHDHHRTAIREALERRHNGPTVVVTHHAPLASSLQHGEWREPLDGAFASDLSELIEKARPDVWVHGHVHVSRDYRHGETRIVANPRGYVSVRRMSGREFAEVENPSFDPGFTLEL